MFYFKKHMQRMYTLNDRSEDCKLPENGINERY